MKYTMPETTVVHEKSYSQRSLGGFIHRARLRTVIATLRRHVSGDASTWADFGCSNGFVIASVLAGGDFRFERIVGYDHSSELLEMAAARHIPNTAFVLRNMNAPPPPAESDDLFDLVTCFETLEHVSDYARAFEHVVASVKPGGVVVMTVPNETGIPGLIKLLARWVVRRNPYGDFFEGKSVASYIGRLLTGGPIADFRKPSTTGYGPHLGFDYRQLIAHIETTYVAPGHLVLTERSRTLLGMNIVLVYRRPHAA